jgi:hypothetical protein
LVEDHLSGRANRRLLIWSLLSLEHWAQAFLGVDTNNELASAPSALPDKAVA